MSKPMEFREAMELLCTAVSPVEEERVPLMTSAGRILAETVRAESDVPPFDRSPFDGYAFRGEDTEQFPVTLRILEEIPAGSVGTKTVVEGTAAKILTGAPIPMGANTVCKFEDTDFTDTTVTLKKYYKPGSNIVLRGEDLTAGDTMAERGERIDAALCGTLATQNIAEPSVFRKLRVGIITTGSELVSVGTPLTGGKIVNSNLYTFSALLQEMGCEVVYEASPSDTLEEIRDAFSSGAEACDLLISTGGVSVGDYDLTPDALAAAGGEILVRNVDLKPGGKCCFGKIGDTLVCCLSGNPASSMTTFYAVAMPAIRKMQGYKEYQPHKVTVLLAEDFPKKSPKPRLLRGVLELREGKSYMRITGEQGNGILHTMIGCNLLALVPAGSGPQKAGTALEGIYLG